MIHKKMRDFLVLTIEEGNIKETRVCRILNRFAYLQSGGGRFLFISMNSFGVSRIYRFSTVLGLQNGSGFKPADRFGNNTRRLS
jgi:hypothetical protein